MRTELTPRQFAGAIGVSESSVKRWIDAGRITAMRTPGGHRRLSVAEAFRYVREAGLPLVRPEEAGLPDLAAYVGDGNGGTLFEFLTSGRAAEAAGLLEARLLAGASVAELIDGPLVEAMSRAGELWLGKPEGIVAEHRATETAVQALSRIRALLPPPPGAPVALGCAPAGDPYLLPTLSAATVLQEEGYRAVNLGADMPLGAVEPGLDALRPRLVWVSCSTVPTDSRLRREILNLSRRVELAGAALVVGGAQARRLELNREKSLYLGASMSELRAVARGLLHSAAAARN